MSRTLSPAGAARWTGFALIALPFALGLASVPRALPAQEKELSKREIAQVYQSPDSTLRHETWTKLNPENRLHYRILVKILEERSWYDRDGAVIALAKAFSEETLDKMIDDLLEDRNRFVRQGMAEALAKMNDPKFYEHLYEALDDRDPYVRRTVVHSLRVHKKPEAVDALIERFQEEENPVVRTFLERTLNELTQAYKGTDPVAWATWWEQAKADEDYELGKTDEDALRQAERLGKKLRERRTVSVSGGVTLSTAEKGSGEGVPILVLPPYGYSKDIMLPFLSELEKSHKLFYIDLPPIGSFKDLEKAGQTDIPYYPIDRLVDAFEDLREDTGQEHFALLSCGMNSWIAMRYAQRFPDAVAANIFVAPISGVKEYAAATRRFERQGKAEDDREMFWFALTRRFDSRTGESHLDKHHRETDEPRPEGQMAAIDRRSWGLFFKYEQDSTISMLYPVKDHPMGSVAIPDFSLFREEPPSKSIPTLVIVGKASLYTSVQDAKAIAKYYGSKLCIVFSHSSCMPFAEESERFNKYVGAFLKKYTRARASKPEAD